MASDMQSGDWVATLARSLLVFSGVLFDRAKTGGAKVSNDSGFQSTTVEPIRFSRDWLVSCKCPIEGDLLEALPDNALGGVPKTTLRDPRWQGRDWQVL